MSVAGTVDVSVEVLGGLVTNLAASDLPHGVSPDCQDAQFSIGSVKTRPGITSLYALPGNPTINYQKTYENLQEVPRFLSLDSLGNLRTDVTPGGALSVISSGILPGSFCKSCSLFAREYLAFGNGINGVDIPRQWDDTNFDRVSQYGPGAAPTVSDDDTVYPLSAVPTHAANQQASGTAITSITQTGNLVTVVMATAAGFFINGENIVIAGVTPSGYNGTFPVTWLPNGGLSPVSFTYVLNAAGLAAGAGGTASSQAASFDFDLPIGGIASPFGRSAVKAIGATLFPVGTSVTSSGIGVGGYNGTFQVIGYTFWTHVSGGFTFDFLALVVNTTSTGLAASGGGQVVTIGNIDAGLHQCTVIFVTRSRYYTKPAPPVSWTAGGGKRAFVSNIPTGPPNVIARIILFTGVGGSSFYHLGPTGITLPGSSMYIGDNTTTQASIDFTDQILLLGTLDDPLFNQIVLPPAAGSIDYSSRLFWWGCQANLQSFLNLSFDGGFTRFQLGPSPFYPLGWTPDAAFANGYSALTSGLTAVFGDAFAILGDGVTAVCGKITQGAANDYLGNPQLQPNTSYSIRARIGYYGALPYTPPTAGTVEINLSSASTGITLGISVPYNQLTGSYLAYSAVAFNAAASIPADLTLQVYVDGTPSNGSAFLIDEIEIYPTNEQFDNSTVRASFGQLDTQGQESYDSQTGLIDYNLNDGQSVRTCFKIRERLYVVKEHSFGVTQDDGVNEPSDWTIDDVSQKIGTPSVNGVGVGEDWVVIAHRTGLYLFWGGEVLKISEEIQPTWDTINWQYGWTISIAVDLRKRRIFVCAPFGASTIPNKTLVLDYHDVGSDASAIASSPPIHLTYTGRKTAFDKARKWCPWTISANSIAQIEQISGETQIYFGSNDGTGNINELDDTGTIFTDNGNTIPSYYTFSFIPELAQEAALHLLAHRKLFSYLALYIQGVGTFGITAYSASLLNAVALNPQALNNPATKDTEMTINVLTERMAIKISSGGNGNWFDLQRQTVNASVDPWAPVRGVN